MKAANGKIHQLGLALSIAALIVLAVYNLMNKGPADRLETENMLLAQKLEQVGAELARKTQQDNQIAGVTGSPAEKSSGKYLLHISPEDWYN